MNFQFGRQGSSPSRDYIFIRLVADLIRTFFNTIFVSSHMYPENPGGTQVIVGSMNMGYIYILKAKKLEFKKENL